MIIEFNKIYSKDIRDKTWDQIHNVVPPYPDLFGKYGIVMSNRGRAFYIVTIGIMAFDFIKGPIWENVIERLRR